MPLLNAHCKTLAGNKGRMTMCDRECSSVPSTSILNPGLGILSPGAEPEDVKVGHAGSFPIPATV